MKFSLLIGTKNRIDELKYTLEKSIDIISSNDVEVILVDDGSTDGTYDFVTSNYPNIKIIRNEKSKGILAVRNQLYKNSNAKYAISLDDDTNFLSRNNLELIEEYFQKNNKCAIISFRTFWSKNELKNFNHNDTIVKVRSFGAGINAMRMSAKKEIPEFPEWFIFYGEEDFASYHLFKKGWEIHYVPDILIHHRVDINSRKKDKDYTKRTRYALRSGWYLILMFYPLNVIPKILAYTLWIQLKNKTFRGDWKATIGITQAIIDVIVNIRHIKNNSSRLTQEEYTNLRKIVEAKLYWTPLS
jgi:glycosyltransferase involved in cell wall biosynthesis